MVFVFCRDCASRLCDGLSAGRRVFYSRTLSEQLLERAADDSNGRRAEFFVAGGMVPFLHHFIMSQWENGKGFCHWHRSAETH